MSTLAPRVLLVEDEEHLAQLVQRYLERDRFEVCIIGDGNQAVEVAQQWQPDVIVLDLGLPGMDGVEVCRRVRTFSDCYVIMLTARAAEVDKLVGLSVGADDYVTKPFSPRELVARVGALLRRPREVVGGDRAAGQGLSIGTLRIDVAAREVHLGDELVDLTRTEFEVLVALAARPRMVFSRRRLIDDVWGRDWVGDEHLVDVHIAHLRRKLGDSSDPAFIRTVRGVGYRMGPGR
ncbi:response regulator transcription factor [Ornithinimicrobium faecis]|uniref:response regulator transcription factor n=1 Tax=Ornithinimicrobium faecis TaxID=2934158 RepID=UPI0021198321|nr:response regulator transcription factor [Ornithinimicrobium sp. HY1745]